MNDTNVQIMKSSGSLKMKQQWIEEGIARYKEQRFKEALEAFEHAIQIDPVSVKALHGRGIILTQLKEYKKAIESYKQASQLAPKIAKIYLDMAEVFYLLEDYAKSGTYYRKAIELNGSLTQIYFDKVETLLKKAYLWEQQECYEDEQYEQALVTYENILAFDPMNDHAKRYVNSAKGKLLVTKGDALFEQKRYAEANVAYREAAKFDYRNHTASNDKAKHLLDEGKKLFALKFFDEARTVFENALLFNTQDAEIYAALGDACFALKLYEEAGEFYRQAAKLDYRLERMYLDIGAALFEEGKTLLETKCYDEAHSVFKNVFLFGPTQVDTLISQGKMLFEEGKRLFNLQCYNEALLVYENVLIFNECLLQKGKNASDKPLEETLVAKGELLFELQRYTEARDTYKLLRDQCNRWWRYDNVCLSLLRKANSLYKKRCYKQAGIAYRLAFLFNPDPIHIDDYKDKGRYLLLKSLEFYLSGDDKQAYSTYLQAVQFDRSNERTTIVCGISLNELRRFIRQHSNKMTLDPQEMDVDADVLEETTSDEDFLQERYRGKRVSGYIHDLEAEVADPDDYDLTYNQYSMIDLGDELDEAL